MKKLIVGAILVCTLTLICIWFINFKFAMVTVQEEKEFEIDGINRLDFQTTAADIEIIPSSTDYMTVKLEGEIKKKFKNKIRMSIAEEGEQMKVTYLSNDNSLGFKLGSEKDVNLRVTIPENAYKELSMHTTSGDVTVENITAENIKIMSTSGDQTIKMLESEGTALFQSTSGNFKLERNVLSNFSIESTSGDLEMKAWTSQSGKINTTSGNITMIIEGMINKLNINTTSGDVKTTFSKSPESLKIDFKGNSGKTDIRLNGIMYEEKDKNSAIGVIGDGINILNVKTESGDFTVK
jgi:lia operon protein LiaG